VVLIKTTLQHEIMRLRSRHTHLPLLVCVYIYVCMLCLSYTGIPQRHESSVVFCNALIVRYHTQSIYFNSPPFTSYFPNRLNPPPFNATLIRSAPDIFACHANTIDNTLFHACSLIDCCPIVSFPNSSQKAP